MDVEKVQEEFKKALAEVIKVESDAGLLEKCKASFDKLEEANKALLSRVSELEVEKAELSGSVESLEASIEEKSCEFDELSNKLKEVEAAMSELEKEKDKLSGELEEIARKEQSRTRLEDLKNEGLLFSEGTLKEKQEKVAYEASDEDFAAYRENLKEMKVAFTPIEPEGTHTEGEEASETQGEEQVGDVTPPADIDKGRESASQVIPNVQDSGAGKPTLKELGECLAEYCAGRRKKISG